MDKLARHRILLLVAVAGFGFAGAGVLRLAVTTEGKPVLIVVSVAMAAFWLLALWAVLPLLRDKPTARSRRMGD